VQVLSASPERFLRFDAETRLVQTRPIKGTRPRGATAEEDAAMARELRESEKDLAENVMIVDVERNDLGRVAEVASVWVPHLAALEEFATVFHLTSTVEGRLRPECDIVDLLLATFPSGSITGAPKIRAMEIIDELEPTTRGVYTGAIGYIGGDGSIDLNIAIRTIVVKDGRTYFHAGGGIVADSDPEMEYEETLHKARALAGSVLSEE
jgi:para-aminobenzoate synthetase component 1